MHNRLIFSRSSLPEAAAAAAEEAAGFAGAGVTVGGGGGGGGGGDGGGGDAKPAAAAATAPPAPPAPAAAAAACSSCRPATSASNWDPADPAAVKHENVLRLSVGLSNSQFVEMNTCHSAMRAHQGVPWMVLTAVLVTALPFAPLGTGSTQRGKGCSHIQACC